MRNAIALVLAVVSAPFLDHTALSQPKTLDTARIAEITGLQGAFIEQEGCSAGIDIVAIHHHMTNENPRFLFLHYWGRGRLDALARALRAALDTQRASGPEVR